MRLIHISLDEKFIDCAVRQFDELKGVESVFCAQTNSESFKYIKSHGVHLFHNADEIVDYANNGGFDFAVLHSICFAPRILLRLNIPILWNSWGYDIYSDKSEDLQKLFPLTLYKPETRKAAAIGPKTIKERLTLVLRQIGILSKRQKRYNELLKRIPYLSIVLPQEYPEAVKAYPHFKLFPFRYVDPQKSKPFIRFQGTGHSILLGNSLDPNNNHIDVLKILESKQIKCKVYIPISYPHNLEHYKSNLKEFTKGLHFVTVQFLETFMPLDQYFQILDECSVAIFGHIRQQASENVYHMFFSGKKIFFFEDSLNYKFYKNSGFCVYKLEELNQSVFDEPLSEENQKLNHTIVSKEEDYSRYMNELQKFFDQLSVTTPANQKFSDTN